MISKTCPCRIYLSEPITQPFESATPKSSQESHALRALVPELDKPNSQLTYSECCQPLHKGREVAESAEALMRSRYSAFVLAFTDYIVTTTVPAQQAYLDRSAIQEWASQTDWAGLQIVHHEPKLGKRHAQVEFKAYYNDLQSGQSVLLAHHEQSTFVKLKKEQLGTTTTKQLSTPLTVKWYFLDPTVSIRLTQKQPCLCGSGEKFKRCCGQYL